jgi:hypothetical protein
VVPVNRRRLSVMPVARSSGVGSGGAAGGDDDPDERVMGRMGKSHVRASARRNNSE